MPASSTPRVFTRKRKLVYGAIVCLGFFAILEGVLRLAWAPEVKQPAVGERKFLDWLSQLAVDDPLDGPLYRRDDYLLWSLVPGATVESKISHRHPKSVPQTARVTINGHGYRGREASASKAVKRVLCLGDSNFFGYPLDDAHAFPAVLERKLAAAWRTEVEVLNGGVPGYTVPQGRRFYEAKFKATRFDYVLLSFVNNDAWPQPQTDRELFAQQGAFLTSVAGVLSNLRLFEFLASFVPEPDPNTFQPRVPLADYEREVDALVVELQSRGTGVILVDHCAIQAYAPYSAALQRLARKRGIGYFGVARRVVQQLEHPQRLDRYPKLAERVTMRWGPELIRARPHLMLYAEMHAPEHLNEVGTAWLSDLLVPLLPTK